MVLMHKENEADIVTVPSSLAVQGINATAYVVKELNRLSETGGTLRFEPGEYHFYEDGALNGFFTPSNNASGKKRVCFPLLDAHGLTVDGGGAVFVFHGMAFPFIVSESSDVTLCNFTVDTAQSTVAALEIIEKAEEGFCCRIDREKSPFRTENGHLIFERENGCVSTADGKLSLHSLTRTDISYLFAGDTDANTENLAAPYIFTDAFDRDDGTVYFRYRSESQIPVPYEIGEPVVINLEEKRERAVFFLENSENVTVRDITLRRGGGMGVIAQLCENVTVENVRTDKACHGDAVTLTADALHFVQCSGTVTIRNCNMESFLDDAVNVHGVYTVVDSVEKDRLHVHLGHAEQDFFNPYKAGDVLRILNHETLEVVCEAVVRDVYFTSNDGCTLAVKAEFPTGTASIKSGFLVENPGRMPDIVLRNNCFRDFPHILLSGEGTMWIENNRICDCLNAAVFRDHLGYWYESGRLGTVYFCGNILENCNKLGGNAFIEIGVSGYEPENAPLIHEHIEITDNTFVGLSAYAVHGGGVKEICLADNICDGKAQTSEHFRIADGVKPICKRKGAAYHV